MGSVIVVTDSDDQLDEEWVTQAESRVLLGEPGKPLGKSTVPKLVAAGLLHPRRKRPSLRRAEVLQLAQVRAEAARMHELKTLAKAAAAEPQPPDDEHEWVRADVVAAFLGVQPAAVHQRTRRGRLPHVVGDGGHRWYQLDQVAMTVHAQEVSRGLRCKCPVGLAGG